MDESLCRFPSGGMHWQPRALQQAWRSFVSETGSNRQDEKRMRQEGVGAREESLTITAISTVYQQLGRDPEAWLAGQGPDSTPHGSEGSVPTTPPA